MPEIEFIPLWSLRWSHPFGWIWKQERTCSKHAIDAWLAAFRKDEPGVRFEASPKTPKIPKGLKPPKVCTCDRLTAPLGWTPESDTGHYPHCNAHEGEES